MSVVQDVAVDPWEAHLKLVCEQLDEKHRRWVAGVFSEVLGHGGTKRVAAITGMDPKTIRQGRSDLSHGLANCPADRVRRAGAGRPSIKKISDA